MIFSCSHFLSPSVTHTCIHINIYVEAGGSLGDGRGQAEGEGEKSVYG